MLPTIQESEFEDESLNSFETVQRRRSPHYLVFGATLVFLMGFLSSRLFPSRTPDTSVTTWDMLGRDWLVLSLNLSDLPRVLVLTSFLFMFLCQGEQKGQALQLPRGAQ